MRELTVSITETISYEVTITVPDDLGTRLTSALEYVYSVPRDILSDEDQDTINDAVETALKGADAWAGADVEDRSWVIYEQGDDSE